MPNKRKSKAARAHKTVASDPPGPDGGPNPLLVDARHPGMLEDPERWERSWAKDLTSLWVGAKSKNGNPNATIASHTSSAEAKVHAMEVCIANAHAVLSCVVRNQISLGSAVAMRSVAHDYEQEWRDLTDARRREIILEGICNSMQCGILIPARAYCPDSTVDFLSSRSGEQYLDFLRALLPDDLSTLTAEPKMIPHPLVDRYLTIGPPYTEQAGYKALARTHQILRIQCMTSIIFDIFQVFVSSFCRRLHVNESMPL